jgi:hypothetical protein
MHKAPTKFGVSLRHLAFTSWRGAHICVKGELPDVSQKKTGRRDIPPARLVSLFRRDAADQ